jgi:hypothetical protein
MAPGFIYNLQMNNKLERLSLTSLSRLEKSTILAYFTHL